jgi:tyrosinase
MYNVYLNLPPGEKAQKHPDLYAGALSMYGLPQASRPEKNSTGMGITEIFDVTDLFYRLVAMKGWDRKNLHIAFVPEPWEIAAQVNVARVSLYFE